MIPTKISSSPHTTMMPSCESSNSSSTDSMSSSSSSSLEQENEQLREYVKTLEARLAAKDDEIQRLSQDFAARTLELEETNRRHEAVNRQVKQQAAAQLEHFACMSHEIRYVFTCLYLLVLDG